MKTITEETFCHDFDEIMDNVMEKKEMYIITTSSGSDVMLVPYDYYERIQGELTQLVEQRLCKANVSGSSPLFSISE